MLALPLAFGLIHTPAVQAQSSSARPRFEVASIKPCRDGDPASARKKRVRGGNFSPGTLRLDCTTVMNLIQTSYVLFADGHVNPRSRIPIEGGPAWIHSALYQVDAKADGARSQGMLHGPMLQALLEDRLKLKIRRQTREVPAYAVTVAKGGLKLHRFQDGSCIPLDLKIFEQFPPPPVPELPPGQKYCGGTDPKDGSRWIGALTTSTGPNTTVEARAMSIDDFIKVSLASLLDRPLVNKTGITGLYDFHMEFAPEDSTEPAGPSIFTALQQQLGLKLEPAKAPADFLVIDQVQRPSPN